MKLPLELVQGLVELGIEAFSRKRRARRILREMKGADLHYESFKSAKAAIDEAAAAGRGLTLGSSEVVALDWAMDRFAKAARKVKKKL